MKSLIKMLVVVSMVTLLTIMSGCNVQQNSNNVTGAVSTALGDNSLNCQNNNYDNFCTQLQGQVFYTINELLSAPVINGSISFQYHLEDFRIFLIGQGHAYTAQADINGNFAFSNVQPGVYSMIGKLMPQHGSEIFTDCSWNYDSHGNPVCTYGGNTERYKIGFIQNNVIIRDQEKASLKLTNVQKLFVDNNGGLSSTQDLPTCGRNPSCSDSYSRDAWGGVAVNLGKVN